MRKPKDRKKQNRIFIHPKTLSIVLIITALFAAMLSGCGTGYRQSNEDSSSSTDYYEWEDDWAESQDEEDFLEDEDAFGDEEQEQEADDDFEDDYTDDEAFYDEDDDEYSDDEEYDTYSDDEADWEEDGAYEDDETYRALSDKLEKICRKKGFSENAVLLLNDTLYRLYRNYPTWYHMFEDMPDVETYINDGFLAVLRKVYEIDFVDENAKRGQELLADGMPAGYTAKSDGKLTITIIAPLKDEASEDERNYSVEELFHEMTHCRRAGITFNSDYFDDYDAVSEVFTEGAATFEESFTNPYTTEVYGMWSITNEEKTRTIDYNKENGIGYPVALNAYVKMVYLLGLDFLEQIEQGAIPFSDLVEELSARYGEKGTALFDTMMEWYATYDEEGWQSTAAYDLAVQFENQFLAIAKREVAYYDNYLEKYLPVVTDKNGNDITDDVFIT